jgi:glycosyltransferase involved in cell wall biosynthesis
MEIKNITIITPFYYPQVNGVSHVAQKNVDALIELGYNVIVLSNEQALAKTSETVYGFDIKGNGTILNPIRGDKKEFIDKALSYSNEASLIVVHCWHIWSTTLILENYNKFKSKIIVYSHGTSTRSWKLNLYYVLRCINYFFESYRLKKYYKLIDGLISITDNVNHYRCLDIKNILPSRRNLILNPIIDRNVNLLEVEKVKNKYEDFFKTNLKVALCLSNYEGIKNQKHLVQLLNKHSFKLICVGSKKTAYFSELKDYVKKNKLGDRVLLDYDVNDTTIEWLFKNSSFFLFASRNDFSPLVLIEASKYGLPFLSYKTADSNRKGGYFCSNDIDYETKLNLYINNSKEQMHKIGEEGLMFYSQNNSYESYKKRLRYVISLFEVD